MNQKILNMLKCRLKLTSYSKSTIHLFLVIYSSAFMLSCAKDKEQLPVETKTISKEIKDLIYFKGEERASVILINAQGGPGYELGKQQVDLFFQAFNTTDALMANVHQIQTLNPNTFSGNHITLDQAFTFNTESVENLLKVIHFFKNQNRKVYVLGVSYGAFLIQELIAKYGVDIADKYMIITGRLNINDEVWQAAVEGKNSEFINGVTPNIIPDIEDNIMERNSMKLFAGIAMNKYTERLNTITDLSKVTYVYGTKDEAVGSLTTEEVQFLQSKNAIVVSRNGNHDQTYDNYITDGVIDTFGFMLK